MPIDIEEYRNPKWIKCRTRYTLTEDKQDRFYKFETDVRGYRDGMKTSGYNPNHNSIVVERVNLVSDNISLKGY